MTEIIDFIKGKGKLSSPPILFEFKETYGNRNGEILPQHVLQFTRLFNNDVVLLDDGNYSNIRQRSIMINLHSNDEYKLLHGKANDNSNNAYLLYPIVSRMFYIYINSDGGIEKWDPITWQHTTNNTSLYTALVAIIRPKCSFEQTKELISKIIDSYDSEGARLLGEISLHFFARGRSYFRYPTLKTIIIPSDKETDETKELNT